MEDIFLSNQDGEFVERIRECFRKCSVFTLSVSFIKISGLNVFKKDIEDALSRGAKGRLITSTYQNFTDIPSLNLLLSWQSCFDNFECHLDYECFGDHGFHSKGYLFKYDDSVEVIIGSSNITRFALMKNVEWNISLASKNDLESYNSAIAQFDALWDKTLELSANIIDKYEQHLNYAIEKWDMDYYNDSESNCNPNSMQRKALREIRRYRDMGIKKTLVISATGSGKTYLAAFDARNFDARRLLYIVHRETILNDAKDTFENVFRSERTYGYYTGVKKELDADFIFATSHTLSKHLDEFDPKEFDYIIYDEVHHIVADTGKKIFDYFDPEFMLGLTATPERMDNKDIFSLFDHNVPFELRLRDAIENDLIVPFHYYGIRDKLVDYDGRDRMATAKSILSQNNIEFIKTQIEKHRRPNEKLKCLAFCVDIANCKKMAEELSEEGYHTRALTGINDTGARIKAFNDLQNNDNELEIICTVDILNEGVDIPQVNMVLFLRPTESQTIFIQQLGRGLRKYPGKDYVTVLDFIGNNYDRAVQIAFALGTLGKTTYMEKAYLKQLIKTNFESLDIPGVVIEIDDLSREEIINYIDKTNFNRKDFLEKDYKNFKKYIGAEEYPKHMDFLNSDVAPDFIRLIKSKINNTKNMSYYSFLRKIGENSLPLFSDDEVKLINNVEDLLPLSRLDEYLIIKQALDEKKIDLDTINRIDNHINNDSLKNAYNNLLSRNIVGGAIDLTKIAEGDFRDYLNDAIEYGIARYNEEFGEFDGKYKRYSNYYTEQVSRIIGINGSIQKGTHYVENDVYIFAGLKKDDEGKKNYKDKFINDSTFQWESIADVSESEKRRLRDSKRVFLFVRKMKEENGITLPYTFFGTGSFTNERSSYTTDEYGNEHKTLLYDIVLDEKIPEDYFVDFEINNQ